MSYHQGFLAGRQWTPVELAGLGDEAGWVGRRLVEFVATCLSESAGREKAHCFNYRDEAKTEQYAEDVGLMQISVWRSTPLPADDPFWDPRKNVGVARQMFEKRGWGPWHGYTNFIATNPAMMGEYIQRAIWGVANFYRKQYGVKQIPYPRQGTALRALIDQLTRNERPLVPPFTSRLSGLRSG